MGKVPRGSVYLSFTFTVGETVLTMDLSLAQHDQVWTSNGPPMLYRERMHYPDVKNTIMFSLKFMGVPKNKAR